MQASLFSRKKTRVDTTAGRRFVPRLVALLVFAAIASLIYYGGCIRGTTKIPIDGKVVDEKGLGVKVRLAVMVLDESCNNTCRKIVKEFYSNDDGSFSTSVRLNVEKVFADGSASIIVSDDHYYGKAAGADMNSYQPELFRNVLVTVSPMIKY